MSPSELEALKKTYDERHGLKPSSDYDSIRKLHAAYCSVMAVETMTQEEKDGIGDYYRRIKQMGEPAYYWVLDAIYVTSRKGQAKRKFEYFIGILKTWMKYGYGYVPSSENEEIVEYFEETVEEQLPDSLRHIISELMANFGAVQVTRMIGSLKSYSKSHAYVLLLKELLHEKYADRCVAKHSRQLSAPQQTAATVEALPSIEVVEAKIDVKKQEVPKTNKITSVQYVELAQAVVQYLSSKDTAVRVSEVHKIIDAYGVDKSRSRDWILRMIMKKEPSIIKTRYGYVALSKNVN